MIDNLRRSIVVLICIWTMMLLVIYGTIVYLHYLNTIKETVNEARHYHTLNLHYRAWNAKLGGVYADAAKVEPNPYLTIPNRDITLPDGTKYTLINPSYMTRMVFDTIRNSADNQIVSKLTSLKYLNPDNAPDQWESEALKQFEQGSIKEKYERTVIGDKPYLRFISPFITDSSCLKCHAHQGYKAGDIRGGISIAVPLKNHLSFVAATSINLAIAFFVLWSLGVLGMVMTGRKHIRQAEEVNNYRNQLLDKVDDLETSKTHVEQLSGKLSIVMNGIPALVAHVDANQRYIYANRYYADWVGLSQEEITGKTVREVIGEEVYDLSRSHIEEALQGKAGELERIVMVSGEARVQHVCFVPQCDEQGTNAAYFAFITDITETRRKNALIASQLHLVQFALQHSLDELLEETLNEAEKLTDSLIGFYHFVAADQITLKLQNWSTRTKAQFCKADGKGMHYDIDQAGVWVDCVHQRKAVIHNDYATLPHRKGLPEGHAPVMRELVVPVMRGDKITAILGIGNKANDYTDEDLATVSILADLAWEIAARKRTEEEQRIMKQQLFQAQKMEAIGQLAGGIAHDFNNLLQAINTFAFLAQVQLKENGLSVMFAEEIVKAGNRAAELTMGLLAFSRKQAMDPKLTDVNGIIEDTHKLLSRVLDKNIDFSISYHDSPLMVMADTGQIQQVLINLATNARDAMPGGGQLKIATGRAVIDDSFIDLHGFGLRGNYATVTVSDSGHGMNCETKAHIFEPFYTTKEQGKGTGLGLSIVYGIVKQHNGFITVESTPASGTIFQIYLPEESDLQSGAVDERSATPFPGGNETIIIVDDEKMIRTAFGSMLRAYGYRVIEASDGNSAEEIFLAKGSEIQLAVMDIVMPQKNGLETLRQLRAIRPDLPALFITGYADEIGQINSQLDEHTALLMKPVEPRQLLESIRQLLAKVAQKRRDD